MIESIQQIMEVTPSPYSHGHYRATYVEEGKIEVFVVQNPQEYAVWNIHPLRKGWQKVYTLKHCIPEEQCVQSIQSLKRLFEKEA